VDIRGTAWSRGPQTVSNRSATGRRAFHNPILRA
jgi:hypothetical protein